MLEVEVLVVAVAVVRRQVQSVPPGETRLELKVLDDVAIRLGHPSQHHRRHQAQVQVRTRAQAVVPVLAHVPLHNLYQ